MIIGPISIGSNGITGIKGLFFLYRSAAGGWYLMTRWGDIHFKPRKW